MVIVRAYGWVSQRTRVYTGMGRNLQGSLVGLSVHGEDVKTLKSYKGENVEADSLGFAPILIRAFCNLLRPG